MILDPASGGSGTSTIYIVLTDFNRYCVMLHFHCGGAIGNYSTPIIPHILQLITGGPSRGTPCLIPTPVLGFKLCLTTINMASLNLVYTDTSFFVGAKSPG